MNVFVLKKPCEDCPFTKDIGLRPGRLKEVMHLADKEGVPFICHKSIYETKVERPEQEEDDYDEYKEACEKIVYEQHVICRGFVNARKGDGGQIYQIAQRLGVLKEVDDPTDPK